MRERHNIVGSEVDRPRPLVYLRPPLRIQKVRSSLRRVWILVLLTAGVCAVLLLR